MAVVSTLVMLMASFNPALTPQTAASLGVLLRGAVLSNRERTVTACLVAAWPWARKSWQAYENVLRRARFSMLQLACILLGLALRVVPQQQAVCLALDEHLVRRWGPYVPAVGMHRDPVRSSHGRNAPSPGHKWVVLSVVVRLPFMGGPVALPILSALYSPPQVPKRNRRGPLYRRHRTVGDLALLLVRIVVRWAPQRRFIACGDGAYATHSLANALRADSPYKALRHTSLVSRFYFDGATYEEPGPYSGTGRPRLKGRKLPSPKEVIETAGTQWSRAVVQWYGGQSKVLWLCSRTGFWYRAPEGLKWIRWVVVRDPEGVRRDEVFFTTDRALGPARIVEAYVRRWSVETTFQEARRHLGLETLRNWSEKSVKRSVPFLFGLYSLIVIWFSLHVEQPEQARIQWPWYEKPHVTFSDMLAAARADILGEALLGGPDIAPSRRKLWPLDALRAITHRCAQKRAA